MKATLRYTCRSVHAIYQLLFRNTAMTCEASCIIQPAAIKANRRTCQVLFLSNPSFPFPSHPIPSRYTTTWTENRPSIHSPARLQDFRLL